MAETEVTGGNVDVSAAITAIIPEIINFVIMIVLVKELLSALGGL